MYHHCKKYIISHLDFNLLEMSVYKFMDAHIRADVTSYSWEVSLNVTPLQGC